MATPSIALAYKRSALMTATKVTTKPPSEEVLRARDDFKDFCVFMGKAPAKHMLEWHNELCTGEDSECLLGIGGPNTAICISLTWLILVELSQPRSKVFSPAINTGKYSLW